MAMAMMRIGEDGSDGGVVAANVQGVGGVVINVPHDLQDLLCTVHVFTEHVMYYIWRSGC